MSRGMGEGWSDFYARALLSTAAEDPNGIYTTGGWVTNQITAGFHGQLLLRHPAVPVRRQDDARRERQAAQPADLR